MMVLGQAFVKCRGFSFAGLAAFAELFLKRKLSFPVSRMWQRWVRRSSRAVVIFGSPNTVGRLYRRRVRWLPVDQAVQQVQDRGLRRDAGPQRQFDGRKHGLFVMLEDQGQDLDHLAVAARRLEHALLQSPEGGPTGVASQGTGVRAKAAIPMRARNRLHSPIPGAS